METLNVQELTNLACVRYGQLITPLDIYKLTEEACELLLKDVVEEYSYYVPMTKILRVNGSPTGTFLGDDVISVRNVRINNFYFFKLSSREPRRQRYFDPHTKMLSVPLSVPIVVECGVKYPVGRLAMSESQTWLKGDTYYSQILDNFRHGTLKIIIGEDSWDDLSVNYDTADDVVTLSGTSGLVTFTKSTNTLTIKDIVVDATTSINISYNTDKAVVQGLSLRDKRFVDLFIGRLMLALGNIKSQLVMDGDVVGFANDDLIAQGQELVNTTLEILNTSSTSYKVM